MVCHSLTGITFSFLIVHKITKLIYFNTLRFDEIPSTCLKVFLCTSSHRSLIKMRTFISAICIMVKNTYWNSYVRLYHLAMHRQIICKQLP